MNTPDKEHLHNEEEKKRFLETLRQRQDEDSDVEFHDDDYVDEDDQDSGYD